ncbi:chorismate mutase [Aureimonas psammosilenae]|uniref:chorismate mutase n=1 Tax=Aureimonas psammosilenae TaxID=2495496 RepID=UPI00126048C1|nr:chorismate mutase [Aureimonas psammosilenae]
MPAMKEADPQRLGQLRAMIDAIDESVHRLLIQRASVIDELIEAKGTAKNGAAFRPGREADMMRRLAARHSGNLPLVAVEHLWREIISTFTALQAPFRVRFATEGDAVAMTEAARFTFGFTVPAEALESSDEVVAWMEEGGTDKLGLVPIEAKSGSWWEGLASAQIVARLPFLHGMERQADVPALVLAPPLADPVPFEIGCYVVHAAPNRLSGLSLDILGQAPSSCLVATSDGAALADAARSAGLDIRAVGGYAAPLRVDA